MSLTASSDTEFPRTVAGMVAERIRNSIVAGDLPAGSKLRQVELAKRFGVSTTPVREALATLQREGLVRIHPQRGAVVFLPSVEDLHEHYEIRIALETLAAGKAAEQFEPAWAEPLHEILEEMRSGPGAARYIELNHRFHNDIYVRSGRMQLVEMIASLRDASSAYLNIYRAETDFPVERLDLEHRAIVGACVDRDGERAAEATRVHLEHTVAHVSARLRDEAE